VAEAKRIRDKVRREVQHPFHGFPLGILHLAGYITEHELEAGQAWARLTYDFARLQGLNLPMPRAVDFARSYGRTLDAEPTPEQIARVRAEKAKQDALVHRADGDGLRMLIEVCIEDREPWAPARLKKVLTVLADYRLGRSRPNGRACANLDTTSKGQADA
jgi:hypothetical protein